jgi:threonyl-tRNA synthetase
MNAYLGTPEMWKEAEDAIRSIAEEKKGNYFEGVGEAAFYGPKLDFMAKDAIGREHQVATIQLDINMPERFNLFCINEKGEEERIVMIHAAIMGSIERFLSVLIEHVAGAFPLWLSPVQISIMPVADRHNELADKVKAQLEAENIRTEVNLESKTLGAKIRQSTLQKVPYMIIIGDKEQEASKDATIKVAVRSREGKDLGTLELTQFISQLKDQIEQYK